MVHSDFPYGAKISWGRHQEVIANWNDVAIWGLEQFGLTGDRYIVDSNIQDMTWWFRRQDDRLIFILRNGTAQCVEFDQMNYEV